MRDRVVSVARTALALAAAFACGVLIALQSRTNGELGARLSDGFLAAVVSFGSGLTILLIASIFWRPGRVGVQRVLAAIRERRMPWWHAVGGAAGALFVLAQTLVVPVAGLALFTVGIVAGQITSSAVIDARGLGTMAARPVSPTRIAGAVLALVAVGVAVSAELRADAPVAALLVPIVSGALVGWQQAVNGQVRQVAGSAFAATIGNFAVGAVLLALALGVHLALGGRPAALPSDPWLYLGGAIGCVFIAGQALVIRAIGVLLLGLAVLSGQLATALVLDVVVPVPGHPVVVTTVIGTALTIVAVAIAALPRRFRTR